MAKLREFKDVDFSMFDTVDLINLALQRSAKLASILPPTRTRTEDWRELYAARLEQNRDKVLELIWNEIRQTYLNFRAGVIALKPASVADIGCGQALIDLLIYDDTEANITLIDIEESDGIFLGFNRGGGAGYASLAKAEKFLVGNGVKPGALQTVNPKTKDVSGLGSFDLACSFFSCGFHYSTDLYEDFFRNQVNKAIIVDARRNVGEDSKLQQYGNAAIITEHKKFYRVLVSK